MRATETENVFATAAKLADMASAAYEPDTAAKTSWDGYFSHAVIRSNNAQGFVLWDHAHAVIAIAGSNDVGDVVQNLLARSAMVLDERGFWSHFGMLLHARDFANGLIAAHLSKVLAKRRVYITGHSLGGAVATLLPLVMPEIQPELICTFGAPRCLSHATAGRYPHAVRRFVGLGDIVPLLPFSRRFSHVGDVRYVTTERNGKLIAERRYGALGKYWRLALTYGRAWWANFLYGRRRSLPLLDELRSQHCMERYCKALNREVVTQLEREKPADAA